jgi:UDP-N-acetylmuramate: L-alanyl-gamma-D-glutamyl-meso-diaminopimelate ligase
MHSLAIAMHDKGHEVTGSDDEIYDPSRSLLLEKGLLPDQVGWRPEIIQPGIDLVVLGMHARQDNPELVKAKSLGLRIQSFPEFIYDLSSSKTRIVVAGSHGKTTTSGIIAHILDHNEIPADRMIGASIGRLKPVAITEAGIIVIEGDEYLSSPEDSRPKFLHYHPQITIITGIAWDHMNVFPTYQSYIATFRQLIESLGKDDTLIYCEDDAELVKLIKEVSPPCEIISYSAHPYAIDEGMVSLQISQGTNYPIKVFGIHNMQNINAALWAARKLKIEDQHFYTAVQSFEGANKRLQVLYDGRNVKAYLDFAHAPSKVKATVHAVREKHPNDYIIACLELHTFSSLNMDYLPQYKNALHDADMKIVYYSPHTLQVKHLPDLSAGLLSGFFNEEDLKVAVSGDQLESIIKKFAPGRKTILLWMSSGRFDGLDLKKVTEEVDDLIH